MDPRRTSPVPWLLNAVIFTVNAVVLAVFDVPTAVVIASAITGLAALVTFFLVATPHRAVTKTSPPE